MQDSLVFTLRLLAGVFGETMPTFQFQPMSPFARRLQTTSSLSSYILRKIAERVRSYPRIPCKRRLIRRLANRAGLPPVAGRVRANALQ